jgi:hypothetical protein
MKVPSITQEETEGTQPRRFWNTILNSTPVVLTVVATVLAGLSSSEMIQAQYHRALAAQNQSKASDQWTFFQFKRTRGMVAKQTTDFLRALGHRGKVSVEEWRAASEGLVQACSRLERDAGDLVKRSGGVLSSLVSRADQLQKSAGNLKAEAVSLRETIQGRLVQEQAQQTLAFLNTTGLPPVTTTPLNDAQINTALKAIAARQTEEETTPVIAPIPEETLLQAINQLEGNVLAVERANKPYSDTLTKLDELMQRQVDLADDCYRAVHQVSLAFQSVETKDEAGAAELCHQVQTLEQRTAQERKQLQALSNEFKAGQFGYTERRYGEEAQHNQNAAQLYEVQIRLSSFHSEKHRTRSKHFFYGMLVAQGGVTIASFSLAMRRKNLMWSLATIVGVCAVVFSAWVYLYK